MKIGIVIPWRPQPSRIPAFEFVYGWYQANFPDSNIYLMDDKPGEKFNLSASRNDGVRIAEKIGCDVVVISDADTFPEIETLKKTIDAAMNDNFIHNPYTSTFEYDKEYSDKILNGEDPKDFPHISHISTGGIYVCKPSSWWAIGGQDEKFIGWGYEDSAMSHAHQVINHKELVKHSGTVHMLNHERTEGIEKPNAYTLNNFYLFRHYVQITNPDKLLELIKMETWTP